MAETAPAPAAAPAKAAKKKSSKPKKSTGPGVRDLIAKAVSASNEKSGVSLAAIKKALAAGGYDVEKNNVRVKTAVKALVVKGTLIQRKGTGASGSFKIAKKAAEPKAKKPVKKAPAKAKKPAAKKPAAAKKTKAAVKKSPKKVKPAAKKPAAKKAAKSPKKATKSQEERRWGVRPGQRRVFSKELLPNEQQSRGQRLAPLGGPELQEDPLTNQELED